MKLRYNYAEAANSLGISKNKIYRRIREGRLRPIYDGSQPFLTYAELRRYSNTAQPNLEPYKKRDVSDQSVAQTETPQTQPDFDDAWPKDEAEAAEQASRELG